MRSETCRLVLNSERFIPTSISVTIYTANIYNALTFISSIVADTRKETQLDFPSFRVACHLRDLRARASCSREKRNTIQNDSSGFSDGRSLALAPRSIEIRLIEVCLPPVVRFHRKSRSGWWRLRRPVRCQPDMLNEYGSFVKDRRERVETRCARVRAWSPTVINHLQTVLVQCVSCHQNLAAWESYCCHPRCLSTSAYRF